MCRGDISSQECHNCLQDAGLYIKQNCPNNTIADAFYDFCSLRYANYNIFSTADYDRWYPSGEPLINGKGSGDTYAKDFNDKLGNLMRGLIDEAAYESSKHFAINKTVISTFVTLYGLVQCTPDLSDEDCKVCFVRGYKAFALCCNGSFWGQMILPSCNLRFSIDPIFADSALVPTKRPHSNVPTTPPPSNGVNGKRSKSMLTAIICSIVVGNIVLLICVWLCLKCWLTKKKRQLGDIGGEQILQYDYSTLKDATSNFSTENKIGEGGFGVVYKGKFVDGKEVAIKRFLSKSSRGAIEFKAEANVVGRLQHQNLVKLFGFCVEQELLLVYEFLPNKSLDRFIFDSIRRAKLSWGTRRDIIDGIARGLLYLHEDSRPKIIHRDLKSSNILLDEEMKPKIADFGIAKLVETMDTHGDTRKVVGTWGYMAPEYVRFGQFSFKSDVFSFGVIILEIISGLKALFSEADSQDQSLYWHAWELWNEGTISDLIDPTALCGTDRESEVLKYIHIALLCVQNDPASRPTMASIIQMLTSTAQSLPLPLLLSPLALDINMPFDVTGSNSYTSGHTRRNSCFRNSQSDPFAFHEI